MNTASSLNFTFKYRFDIATYTMKCGYIILVFFLWGSHFVSAQSGYNPDPRPKLPQITGSIFPPVEALKGPVKTLTMATTIANRNCCAGGKVVYHFDSLGYLQKVVWYDSTGKYKSTEVYTYRDDGKLLGVLSQGAPFLNMYPGTRYKDSIVHKSAYKYYKNGLLKKAHGLKQGDSKSFSIDRYKYDGHGRIRKHWHYYRNSYLLFYRGRHPVRNIIQSMRDMSITRRKYKYDEQGRLLWKIEKGGMNPWILFTELSHYHYTDTLLSKIIHYNWCCEWQDSFVYNSNNLLVEQYNYDQNGLSLASKWHGRYDETGRLIASGVDKVYESQYVYNAENMLIEIKEQDSERGTFQTSTSYQDFDEHGNWCTQINSNPRSGEVTSIRKREFTYY